MRGSLPCCCCWWHSIHRRTWRRPADRGARRI